MLLTLVGFVHVVVIKRVLVFISITCRLLLVWKERSMNFALINVCMLQFKFTRSFNLLSSLCTLCICFVLPLVYQVTVENGPVVKQSRLANAVNDLAGRLTLNARYYLKHCHSNDTLVADDVAKGILVESRVAFLQVSFGGSCTTA